MGIYKTLQSKREVRFCIVQLSCLAALLHFLERGLPGRCFALRGGEGGGGARVCNLGTIGGRDGGREERM